MADDTPIAGGQAPTTNQPQAGAPNTTSGQAPDGANTKPKPSLSHEEALSALEAARQEAAERRVKLKDYETKLKAYEDAQLSEAEKKDKALSEAQQAHAATQERLQRLTVRAAVLEQAPELGINPKLAARLIDWSSLKLDEDGTVTNMDKVLKALLDEFPEIAAKTPSNTPQPTPRQNVPPSNPQRGSSGSEYTNVNPRNIPWSQTFKQK